MKKLGILFTSSLLAFTGVNAQRVCGSFEHQQHLLQQNPALVEQMQAIERQTENYVKAHPNGERLVVTIPVVVHVVYKAAGENITNAQIQSQIDVLNADFRKLNADASLVPAAWSSIAADCEVNFCLAQRDPAGNATTGIERRLTTVTSFSTNDAMKYYAQGGLDIWDRTKYLNLWSCNMGGGILGYAQFPGGAAATDGVVILYSAFGSGGSAAAPFNKGRTGTHEVGHWLNLYHIWGDDGTGCNGSDNVSDTPNQADENYGCPAFPQVSCSNGANGDMFMNYMDYTDDACMYMFTAGQKTRMQALFAAGGARVGLTTSNGCTPPAAGGCSAPSSVAASAITTTGATISWAAVAGATTYTMEYKTAASATWIVTAASASTSRTLTGLTIAAAYNVRVKTTCSATVSAYSTTLSFTTASACSSTYEPNNTSATAVAITPGTTISSQIQTTTDLDFYSFSNTSTNKNIKITLTNLPADYDVTLYYPNGSAVATSQNGGTTAETIIKNYTGNPTVGVYKVKVYGYGGVFSTTACYSLLAQVGSAAFTRLSGEIDDNSKPIFEESIISPNPTDGIATLRFNLTADADVAINVYDQMGRLVRTLNQHIAKDNSEVEMNFSEVTNGIYFVQVVNGESITTHKLVVNK